MSQHSGEIRISQARIALRRGNHEYARVAANVADPVRLLAANETTISPEDAIALNHLLAGEFSITPPTITFGKRAWAMQAYNRIQLPSEPPYLSFGTVLHEFAHIIAKPEPSRPGQVRRVVHGPSFVRALDEVLQVSLPLWCEDSRCDPEEILARLDAQERERREAQRREREALEAEVARRARAGIPPGGPEVVLALNKLMK